VIRRLACALAFAVVASPGGAQLPPPVEAALKAGQIPLDRVGVFVVPAAGGPPLATHNADKAMNPASVAKVVTTYAALEMLGPAYTWRTTAHGTGSLQDGVLAGDLHLRGQGDPKLTLEAFWLLLRSLRARGVRDIRGDLVLDRSHFEPDGSDAGRFDKEPLRPYNTLPDALLVNFKSVSLQFVPDTARRTVAIVVEPPLPEVRIVANVTLDQTPCDDGWGWVFRLKDAAQFDATGVTLTLTGAYSANCGERSRPYNVLEHPQYVGSLFRVLWRELGGTLGGAVRDGPVPANAPVLATSVSPALAEVVRDINKYSNNVMARQLFLTLGATALGAPATLDKSNRAVRQWLAEKRLDLPDLVLENGSGLSRVERISAKGLGDLLGAAWRSPVMPELIASMPVVGVDGTLRRQSQRADFAGQAHIKGGTLNGVRAMAGYVLTAGGERLVVACLINHPNVHNGNAQPVFDALLRWTHAQGGECCTRPAAAPARMRKGEARKGGG
jgi:D-alanyl-D-alanine carboxypeptidase/D-alanyl-D-alanine-endopeptidase (penicillin-binding protein 4)